MGASISNTATLLIAILPLDMVMMLPYAVLDDHSTFTPTAFRSIDENDLVAVRGFDAPQLGIFRRGLVLAVIQAAKDHGQPHIALDKGDQYLISNLWDKVKAVIVARIAVAHAAFQFHLVVTPDELDHEAGLFADILCHGSHDPFFHPVEAFVSGTRK